jgi:phosphoribosylaminoimidazole-succinocarboxamide synthase
MNGEKLKFEYEHLEFREISFDSGEGKYKFLSKINGSKRKTKIPKDFQAENAISCFFFEYLTGFHVPTYFLEKEDDFSMKIKNVNFLPFEIRFFNKSNEEIAKNFDLEENTLFESPIITFHLLDKKYKDKTINNSHIYAFGILEPEEMKFILKQARKINALLKSYFVRRNLELDELTLRFARNGKNIYLAHEFSSETMKISEKEIPKKVKFNFETNPALALYERIIGL